ncbi:hypothetical protein RFI_00153 [Reticulomyxa filosa]|uniref:Kelch motif family protein n=1 Tax=Reticulomyxa filosa TaxID=46433 RepID=X6PFQ2_RETFI|nr:hypothetical protein RFI_00153 [Reticulomyxa filosa]|eukprot:ETO36908.1 hypothetical protein RFI_00153 [Reticulomyxa filosa]
MAKQTTTQKPTPLQGFNESSTPLSKSQQQQATTSTPFQDLKELLTPLSDSQCVTYKHEVLICGGRYQRACYSYHTLKNEYKIICHYPSDVQLYGHCVVKLVDNNNKDTNQITLLSFGGSKHARHTLVMKYVNAWSNDNDNESNILNKYNQWIPFTDNHNHPIQIGRYNDEYVGVRAVIGGRNNHLLFITYSPKNISVFDLNTFKFIKHDTLPTNNYINFHCFVSKSREQEMMKTNEEKNEQNYRMLLFCFETGLSMEYDENNNTFQFHQLSVCDNLKPFFQYAYVCINDVILFFGGYDWHKEVVSKSVHKYSIRENKWITFQNTLPSPLHSCVAILSEDSTCVHIIGGYSEKNKIVPTHVKTKLYLWDVPHLVCLFK